ncbi:SAM-dependent methyltransferase [Streptomyces sp. NBC_01016]|uniref:class I SAM-dependent methyltransferase n=1 Tax=Streptomyces sp. NBC_01016 TaxID=2903720 RepID=UPI0022597639|nr:SAM-dependent methyltransferase [Streptomyces sp. NBC_01016]MCX4835434.1 SAM-dependent methyltransferase [Streptomyces sp. NBC_01016]
METGQPSRTAMAVARARAQHQLADEPRVFTDPFAVRVVGEAALGEGGFDRGLDPDLVRRRRLWIAARSRFADDTVTEAVASGCRQVVVLGAGLDTSALRNTHPDVSFFEVDHPDTQRWKQHRLADAGIAVPPTLTFVPVDFESTTLAEGLAGVDFDRTHATAFLMLGVAMYLTLPSLTATWRFITEQGSGSVLVMDYLHPAAGAAAAALDERAKRVAAAGEPWLSSFTADELRGELSGTGFSTVEDRSAAEVLGRYLGRTVTDSLGSGHLVRAAVA